MQPIQTFTTKRALTKLATALLVMVILLAVFAMYLQPDFLVLLANQIWLCF